MLGLRAAHRSAMLWGSWLHLSVFHGGFLAASLHDCRVCVKKSRQAKNPSSYVDKWDWSRLRKAGHLAVGTLRS
jgi:hypothetical protein